jgi:hypothetical protein
VMIHLSEKNNHESIVRDMCTRLLQRNGVQLELGIATQSGPTAVYEITRRRARRRQPSPHTQLALFA